MIFRVAPQGEADLEMLNVDDVEPDDGGEETNVSLGDVFAVVVRSVSCAQVLLSTVERFEERRYILLISFLRAA